MGHRYHAPDDVLAFPRTRQLVRLVDAKPAQQAAAVDHCPGVCDRGTSTKHPASYVPPSSMRTALLTLCLLAVVAWATSYLQRTSTPTVAVNLAGDQVPSEPTEESASFEADAPRLLLSQESLRRPRILEDIGTREGITSRLSKQEAKVVESWMARYPISDLVKCEVYYEKAGGPWRYRALNASPVLGLEVGDAVHGLDCSKPFVIDQSLPDSNVLPVKPRAGVIVILFVSRIMWRQQLLMQVSLP